MWLFSKNTRGAVEKRKCRRVQVDTNARVRKQTPLSAKTSSYAEPGWYTKVTNLSITGAAIRGRRLPSKSGRTVELLLPVINGESVALASRVMWARKDNGGYVCGVRFSRASSGDKAQFVATMRILLALPDQPSRGSVIGRIELVPGIPFAGCLVVIEGMPLGAYCDKDGIFEIRHVPIGRQDLRIIAEQEDKHVPVKRIGVGVNPNSFTDVGTVIVSQCGAVSGRILGARAEQLAAMVVRVEDFGIFAKPDAYGYYLLSTVPPGNQRIMLHGVLPDTTAPKEILVTVNPGQLVYDSDFHLHDVQQC